MLQKGVSFYKRGQLGLADMGHLLGYRHFTQGGVSC